MLMQRPGRSLTDYVHFMRQTFDDYNETCQLLDGSATRCLKIIVFYEPRLWLFENLATGLLKTREIMPPLSCGIHTCS
jgi:hypothetical protein